MCIGLKIKELASKENITLADLAKKLGKTKQAVYEMVEKDDVNTSIIRKLSAEFHVPIDYFFSDNETSGVQVVADNHSQAVGIGNITHTDSQSEAAILKEHVRLLEKLLEEKERTIQILMSKNNNPF